MKRNIVGFSIVELIIAVSIIIILSVIGVTTMDGAKDRTNTSKVLGDIGTLNNTLKSYAQDLSDLPMPKGNLKFYGDDTSYRHDYSTAFGVSGFITQDVLPAKYMNNLPLDPKTGQFYAYSKTKNSLYFEVAGVVYENASPKSKVSGNWKGEFGPYNLVKEYAGPNYVYNDSDEYFPYNPEERMLIGKVSSFSGVVKINGNTLSNSEVLSYHLGEGDQISVSTGGIVDIYLSDGSNTVLGDTDGESKMTFTQMRYVEDNNLFTSIKLALNIGSLWTKASKLSDKSEFQVDTSDAVAAVRGTIFGVKKSLSASNIVVQEGKVKTDKKNGETLFPVTGSLSAITMEGTQSYIDVKSGSGAQGVELSPVSVGSVSTGALDTIPEQSKNNIVHNIPELNNALQVDVIKVIKSSNSNFQIVLDLNDAFLKAQYLKVISKGNSYFLNNNWQTKNNLFLTGGLSFQSGSLSAPVIEMKNILNVGGENQLKVAFCSLKNEKERCSKTELISLKDSVTYDVSMSEISGCEPDADQIYKTLFGKPISKILCKTLISNPSWAKKTFKQKENFIKKQMQGKYCTSYQNKYGTLTGMGYMNCKPNKLKIGDEKVDNILAPQGYQLQAYAGYDINYDMINISNGVSLTSTGNSIWDHDWQPFLIGTGVFQDSATDQSFSNSNLGSVSFSVTKDALNLYEWGTFGKGIFIDNTNGTQDYLKTDITPLSLAATGNFAIEVSVRGAALKNRTSGNYTLFQVGNLSAKLDGGVLKSGIHGSSSISFTNAELTQFLENDKFYSFVVQYTKNTLTLSIYDGRKNLFTRDKDNAGTFSPSSQLYIGTYSEEGNYTSQWNDIINFVKIYTKPKITREDLEDIVSDEVLSISGSVDYINEKASDTVSLGKVVQEVNTNPVSSTQQKVTDLQQSQIMID